ncbi:hypothetical protein LZ554_006676 [Drepanopeziza brunnea f. sp. 'monogermtubi']|nr:hypothetical protein LZ554_006676 [Drepanopeziza brunnea f. sp. 'monogermtubi']
MEGLRINELLANGYFKTKAARSRSTGPDDDGDDDGSRTSPSPSSPQASLLSPNPGSAYRAHSRDGSRGAGGRGDRNRDRDRDRERSSSRTPRPLYRGPPPPRPTVEDECVSLAREGRESVRWPDYGVPVRGTVDQNPVILEADVGREERDRLQNVECSIERGEMEGGIASRKRDENANPERRFVFVPQTEGSGGEAEESRRRTARDDRNGIPEEPSKPDIRREASRGEYAHGRQARSESKREEPSKYPGKYIPQPVRPETNHSRHDHRRDEPGRETARQEPRKEERRETARHESRKEDRTEEEPRRRDQRPEKSPRQSSFRREEPTREDSTRREVKTDQPRPPLENWRSRQELPTLETKVPREIPPKFRRSASAFAISPSQVEAPKAAYTPRTPSDYFLSPEAIRPTKDNFSQSTPRQQVHDVLWGKNGNPTEKRNSGSYAGSLPGTPNPEKINSGNFERSTRPQQLQEEAGGRRERRHSPERGSNRSSRSSTQRKSYYSSSEDDLAGSDAERHRRSHLGPGREEQHLRSPSKSNRSSMDPRGSRRSSPLPSPRVSPSQVPRGDHVERAGTFPQSGRQKPRERSISPHSEETPRADRLNPMEAARPKSRQSSVAPPAAKNPAAAHGASLPIPTPSRIDLHSPGETRRSPATPQFQESPRPGPWQPPSFQPPSDLERPTGSYRRYSQDIETGSVAPLPTCPRTQFTRGKDDWLTLPECPGFDICPSCFNSITASTVFRYLFIPAPRRPPDVEVLCDFGSSPWYRIAWLLTIKERRRDLNLFYGLARNSTKYPPCLGKHEAVRQWHSVIDHKTGAPVRGFDVCYSCVKSVETLLPAIRGVFVCTDTTPSTRVCDLRFDSKRFVQYFDALENCADRVSDYHDALPDTRDLVSLARRLALFEECQRERDLVDRRWHVITHLPEFTVCEECFDEVVWPELEEGKAIPLMFNKTLQRLPKASCQLYSAKMRGIFRLAVDSGDYQMLASKARERKSLERAWKGDMEIMRRGVGGAGVERELRRLEEEWRRCE